MRKIDAGSQTNGRRYTGARTASDQRAAGIGALSSQRWNGGSAGKARMVGRRLECDEDKERFEAKLAKIAKASRRERNPHD
jgi:hypothetical protein